MSVHEYLTPAGKGENCRACGLPRNHVCHSLPDVQVSIGPMHGASDPPQFSIQIKDGMTLIARVYLSAEDLALALSGRMVTGKLAPRYKPTQGD
jgi:hypothetical protein